MNYTHLHITKYEVYNIGFDLITMDDPFRISFFSTLKDLVDIQI